MEELRAECQQLSESTGSIGRSKGASIASSQQQISVTVVTEFVRWNEEAIARCTLFSSQVYAPTIHINNFLTYGHIQNVCLIWFYDRKFRFP